MASRLTLQNTLCTILGSNCVYFQPPESFKMQYPCIRYKKVGIDRNHADNQNYRKTNRYEIVVIDPNPDSNYADSILDSFEMCSFDRTYISDNLNHFVLTLYY